MHLSLTNICKSFPGVRALDQVDFSLQSGSIHALVGENGAGKSTLINILSGVLTPDAGQIIIENKPVEFQDAQDAHQAGIVTVYQDADLFTELSLTENIGFQSDFTTSHGWIHWQQQRERAKQVLQEMDLDLPTGLPASELTAAQRQLLSIAIAVSQQTKVLILDEPTSSLSQTEAQALFEHLKRLRQQGVAILYVSHRLEDIFTLADEVTVLRDGERVWTGPIADTSIDHLIRQMVGRAIELISRQPVHETGNVLLSCQSLTSAEGEFSDISLSVRAGEVLGIYGLIGAGRSEWAQAVFGLRQVASGEVQLHDQTITGLRPEQCVERGLAYLPEDRLRQGICRNLSVKANGVLSSLRNLASMLWVSTRQETSRAEAMVEQLSVRCHSIHQHIGTLSGGNQQKVVLGRWLATEPEVFILDEPTQGIDIGSKTEIHQLIHQLAEAGKGIVLISSELPEVLSQSDRIVVFREGKLVAEFEGRSTTAEEVAAAAVPSTTEHVKVEENQHTTSRLTAMLPIRELALLIVLILLFGGLQLGTGEFLRPAGIRNLVTDAGLLSFCALGAMIVLLVGGLDISLGSIMALSAGIAGTVWQQGIPWPLVLILAMLIGAACGFINAALSLIGKVHPIVITLGTMSLYRGLTLWWLQENLLLDYEHRSLFLTRWFGLEILGWLSLGVLIFIWVFLRQSILGRKLYAVGSNPVAAHRVGIHRGRIWLLAFSIQGALLGLAGMLYLVRSGDLQPIGHEEKTLLAIAAAVIGGVSITGGRGLAWGVVLGCLFLVSLGPACTLVGIPIIWQRTIVGIVMVIAVSIDALWRREKL